MLELVPDDGVAPLVGLDPSGCSCSSSSRKARKLAGRTSCDFTIGTVGSDHDPVNQLRQREVPARLVLQRSERDVVTWAAKVERDPVDPGEQLMPLGSGLHLHVDQADGA